VRANLWIVAAVLPLSACAMSAPPPSTSARLGLAMRPADPESLEGWQSVVDQHAGALARLALAGPRAELPAVDAARPGTAGSTRPQRSDPSVSPAPPAPPMACESATVVRKRTYARTRSTGTSERPLTRCERACLHVGAICYASQRICRLADRLEDPSARRSCAGAQQRCLDGQEVARRAGCGQCSTRP